MQVILSKDIFGYVGDAPRVHAHKGETLDVILQNKTHFICDSIIYPDTAIIVFPSQCKEVLVRVEEEDRYAPEKYYNTYVEPDEIIKNDLSDQDEDYQ